MELVALKMNEMKVMQEKELRKQQEKSLSVHLQEKCVSDKLVQSGLLYGEDLCISSVLFCIIYLIYCYFTPVDY